MDYIFLCNFAGYRSMVLSLFYLLNDLRYNEIKLRNLNPKNYSIDKRINKYIYGVLRKISYIYGSNYTNNYEEIKYKNDLLLTDYFYMSNYAGLTSIILFPIYLFKFK